MASNGKRAPATALPTNPLDQLAPRHTLDETCGLLRSMRLTGLESELRKSVADPGFAELHFIDQFHSILAAEANRRGLARYERHRKAACIPVAVSKEAAKLAASGIDGLTRAQRGAIGLGAWEDEPIILIIGKSGSGKSTLAASMADLLLRKGRKVRFSSYSNVMFTLCEFLGNGCSGAWSGEIKDLARNDTVILDDAFIGEVRKGEPLSLKELIDASADRECQLILCSQLDPTEWHQHLIAAGGGTAGTNTADAVADRLSNGTFMVRLRDSTHRTKECRVVSIGGDGGGDGKRD